MGTNHEPVHSDVADRLIDLLTARQRQCLRGVFDGCEIKEIARSLDISTRVVEEHLAKARAKLGVSRSVAAARLVGAALGWASVAPPGGPSEVDSATSAPLYSSHGREPKAAHTVRDNVAAYRSFDDEFGASTGEFRSRHKEVFDRVVKLLVVTLLLAGLVAVLPRLQSFFTQLASIVRPTH